MKELRTLCFDIIKLFCGVELDCENDIEALPQYIDDLGDLVREILLSDKKDKYLNEYIEIVENANIDYFKEIFQEFKKDRENLNQDYTPRSAAKLLAELVYYKGAKTVYDVCCGSGALSIELHNINNDLSFVCYEYDDNVIPYLLFNLVIRNMDAVVIRGDIFTGQTFDVYRVEKGVRFSSVKKIDSYEMGEYDICVSNPPFNVKKISITNTEGFPVAVGNDSNNFFVNHLLKHSKKRTAIIFPLGFEFAKTKSAINTRKYIIDNKLLQSIIYLPEKLFEYTPIQTEIVILDKSNKDNGMYFLDTQNYSSFRIRDLRGSCGGKAHTNRIYHKKFSDFSDENISQIKELVDEGEGIVEQACWVFYDNIRAKDYTLGLRHYCEQQKEEKHFRSYAEIFADLARLNFEEIESNKKIEKLLI